MSPESSINDLSASVMSSAATITDWWMTCSHRVHLVHLLRYVRLMARAVHLSYVRIVVTTQTEIWTFRKYFCNA